MKQYCRYCSNASYGDVVYCHIKQDTINESTAKRVNKCKHFEFNEMDVFNPEHIYKPQKEKQIDKTIQMVFE